MGNKRSVSQIIAPGGICLALTVICIWLASFIPAELSMYAISSVLIGIMIIEAGMKGAWLLYVSSLLLCFILVPNKLALLPYAFFFGLYGIIKYYAERINNKPMQYVAKIGIFTAVFAVAYLFFNELFFEVITLPAYSTASIFILAIILFVLYDYIFSGLLSLYRTRIKREKESREDPFKLS